MKIIIILFVFLNYSNDLLSQYGWTKIYNADTCGILRFNKFPSANPSYKNMYFQLGYNGNVYGAATMKMSWCRFNRNIAGWLYFPHNGFMHSNPFYCSWPNSQGWRFYSTTDFTISKIDSNFILQVRDVPPCGPGILEPIQDTRLTYDNGSNSITLPQFGNGFVGNQCGGFDIDYINDSIIYFAYRLPFEYVYKTTNKGANWFIVDTLSMPSNGFLKISPFNRNTVFISGTENLYKSTNSGYNFISVDNRTYKKLIFNSIDSSIFGLNHYMDGGIYKSTNGGNNWILKKTGRFYDLEIDPSNQNIVFAGGDSGLYKSVDGGNSWFLFNNSFSNIPKVIGLSKDPGTGDTIYAATNTAIYKVWGAYTGLIKLSEIIPDKFSLHQNYPNPFNPKTKIRFSLPSLSKRRAGDELVRLEIYNSLGQEVKTLVNESLTPGTYEVTFDGSNLTSGIYYYTLKVNENVYTKKMVLLK